MKLSSALMPFLALGCIGSTLASTIRGQRTDYSFEVVMGRSVRKLQMMCQDTDKSFGESCDANKHTCCDPDYDSSQLLNCFDSTCQHCSVAGQDCESNDDCCGTALVCDEDQCVEECLADGSFTSCASDRDCCDLLTCFGGFCQDCIDIKQACTESDQCCGGLVCDSAQGICIIPEPAACKEGCADFHQECSSNSTEDCCGGLQCVDNVCESVTSTPTTSPTANPTFSPTASPTQSPTGSPTSESCVNITFEEDSSGTAIDSGEYVENQWANFGVRLSSRPSGSSDDTAPRLFDTADPGSKDTCGDEDLGAPNEACSPPGPGVGTFGAPDQNSSNCEPLGNVLIIQEPNSTCPDDYVDGGEIFFDFDPPAHRVSEIGFLDIDDEADVEIVEESGGERVFKLDPAGANGKQTLVINMENVVKISVSLKRSGAVTFVAFCYDPASVAPTNTPTGLPTASPTRLPTASPTGAPTAALAGPTKTPTAAPTSAPTSFPASSPTNFPVAASSESPLGTPTSTPTPPTDSSNPCEAVALITDIVSFVEAIEQASTDPADRSTICVDVKANLSFDSLVPAVQSIGLDITGKYFDAICVSSNEGRCNLKRPTKRGRFFFGSEPLGVSFNGFRFQNGHRVRSGQEEKKKQKAKTEEELREIEQELRKEGYCTSLTEYEQGCSGGALLFFDGTTSEGMLTEVALIDCDFTNNKSDGDGGAVVITTENDNDWNVTVMGCLFKWNEAYFYGGGFSAYNEGSGQFTLTISETEFQGNKADIVPESGDIDVARNVEFACNENQASATLVQDAEDNPITDWKCGA